MVADNKELRMEPHDVVADTSSPVNSKDLADTKSSSTSSSRKNSAEDTTISESPNITLSMHLSFCSYFDQSRFPVFNRILLIL